jgi:SWI/SNF-related matrix-associated actin-dependent regulator of chromatin subfamily A-like protein 1
LPEKTRQKIIVEISNKEEYDTALNDLAYYLREYKQKTDAEIKRSLRGEVMVRIGVLKQISARGKVKSVMENIKDTLEQDEKIVLFGHHREVLNEFKEKLRGVCVSITGEENSNQRQYSIDSFQNDVSTKIAICSITSAGVGLTLTAGRITMFIEMGWHPAIMEQAEDRQHRLGQRKEVHCVYFLGQDTIDEWIYDLIEKKREVSDAITGCTEDIEWNVVESVIDLILEKKG